MLHPPNKEQIESLTELFDFYTKVDITGGQSNLTDLGNAKRFSSTYGKRLRYCIETGAWIYYDGQLWRVDNGFMAMTWAINSVKSIYLEAQNPNLKDEEKEEILKHAKKSSSPLRMKAILELVKSEQGISITQSEFDRYPMHINVGNGILNLFTGALENHDPKMFLTKQTSVPYLPDETCPRFEAFLYRIMNGDQEKIHFLHKVFGYALTADISEQCLFILQGKGENGKSTLIEILRKVLGGYAVHTPSQTLFNGGISGVRNDLARLKGARFVSATEVGIGKKLDEPLVKQLTGGDQMTARYLRKEYFEYKPEFKLFITANHAPEIVGVDEGIWRRIRLVNFDAELSPDEIELDLSDKLEQEMPGILAWAVKGCLLWQREGLGAPPVVVSATRAYRQEMDSLASFIEDCCEVGTGKRFPLGDAYDAYNKWCKATCSERLGKKQFGAMIRQKGFAQAKSGDIRYWNGIGLKAQAGAFSAPAFKSEGTN